MSAHCLDIGFFPAFKGSDSVLLHGNPAALYRLAEVFIELAQEAQAKVALGELSWVAVHSVQLRLCTGKLDSGMGGQVPNFEWVCKPSTWSSFSEQLESLAASPHGHVYLDTPNQRFSVLASCNEYQNLFAHATSAA